MTGYARSQLRNYWKEAGYVEEMEAREGVGRGNVRRSRMMSERWLADSTLRHEEGSDDGPRRGSRWDEEPIGAVVHEGRQMVAFAESRGVRVNSLR
jgi:hypothetical protein